MDKKQIAIIGGGTISWIRNHLALSAPAYGKTACKLTEICEKVFGDTMDIRLYLTRMAENTNPDLDKYEGMYRLETNEDIEKLIDDLVSSNTTKIVFFNASMVDFKAYAEGILGHKDLPRLKTSGGHEYELALEPTDKVIKKVRQFRKDIFLIGFKQTHGLDADAQYIEGLGLCKSASCNLVLANDTKTRLNMVITPEEARYHVTTNRREALEGLVNMTKLRSHLTFTRSTVVSGEPVDWNSGEVPDSLRKCVEFCVKAGAYKPFRGSTVGHFACKIAPNEFLTSIRRSNFNDIEKLGLVRVKTDGPDTVLAYGAKPSVGGQSQRIIFGEHPEYDCVLHFHCPKLAGSEVPEVSQYAVECGSHQCGQNTSNGLKRFGNLSAVYLENHGPNIVFNRNIDPEEVIKFVQDNFDLDQKTGGFVSIKERLSTPNTLEVAQSVL